MEKQILVFGTIFIVALIALGCTGSQQTTTQPTTNVTTAAPAAPTEKIITEENIPLYQAPLDSSKFSLKCTIDSDCKLIKYQTGSGLVRKCVSATSVYEGVASSDCYCYMVGTVTQTLANGTELASNNYECRNKA